MGSATRRWRTGDGYRFHHVGVLGLVERSAQVVDNREGVEWIDFGGAIHEVSGGENLRGTTHHDATRMSGDDGSGDGGGSRGGLHVASSTPHDVADPAFVSDLDGTKVASEDTLAVLLTHEDAELDARLDVVVVPRVLLDVEEGLGDRRLVASQTADGGDDDLGDLSAAHGVVGAALTSRLPLGVDITPHDLRLRQHSPPARGHLVRDIGTDVLGSEGGVGTTVVLHEVVHLRDELVTGDVSALLGNGGAVAHTSLASGDVGLGTASAVLVGAALNLLDHRLLAAVADASLAGVGVRTGAPRGALGVGGALDLLGGLLVAVASAEPAIEGVVLLATVGAVVVRLAGFGLR